MRALWRTAHSPFLAALTQGLGLLQLLLLVGGSPSSESDSYFYLITWAQLPTQILLSGYVYPTWLSAVTGVRRRLILSLTAAPLVGIAGVLCAAFIFSGLTAPHAGFAGQVGLFSVLALLLTAGWAFALRLSADGTTSWASSVTLAANVLSCAVLGVLWSAPQSTRLTAMLAAQIVGMVLTVTLIIRKNPGIFVRLFHEPTNARQASSKVDWYLAQAIAAYGGLLVLQTASIALAPAALSILGLIGRFVSGLNTVITSALVPRLVHANTTSDHNAVSFVRITSFISLVVALAASVAGFVFGSNLASQVTIVLCWFAAATLNSTFKRLAVRSLEPRTSLASLTLNLLTGAVVAILAYTSSLTLELLILAYILMDLLPGVALGFFLKRSYTSLCISASVILITLLAAQQIG